MGFGLITVGTWLQSWLVKSLTVVTVRVGASLVRDSCLTAGWGCGWLLWRAASEASYFTGKVFLHVGCCVDNIHAALGLVDSANRLVVGEDT